MGLSPFLIISVFFTCIDQSQSPKHICKEGQQNPNLLFHTRHIPFLLLRNFVSFDLYPWKPDQSKSRSLYGVGQSLGPINVTRNSLYDRQSLTKAPRERERERERLRGSLTSILCAFSHIKFILATTSRCPYNSLQFCV